MGDVHDRIKAFWDRDSETYDRSPSHALTDPLEAAAWRAVLRRHLPGRGRRVLEAGAGTGSITLLLAELGHRVTALDLSEAMLARARGKLAHLDVEFVVGPADRPPPGPFDAVVERNMLWTNPDPVRTLTAWREVAADGGRLLLLEGVHGGFFSELRERVAVLLRRVAGIPEDHHEEYDPELWSALPLAGTTSPGPLVDAVGRAGWTRIRLERLRDVEWIRRQAPPRFVNALDTPPLYAVAAER
jgi:SAM-dependent methyltransferase